MISATLVALAIQSKQLSFVLFLLWGANSVWIYKLSSACNFLLFSYGKKSINFQLSFNLCKNMSVGSISQCVDIHVQYVLVKVGTHKQTSPCNKSP